jgi:hypothetical protein
METTSIALYIPLGVSIIALVGSLVASALQYKNYKASAHKSEADASETIARAATSLLKPYQEENEKLQAELKDAIARLEKCLERCPE